MIIDAWAQHPTLRHTTDPMFDSLRRWTRTEIPSQELPVAATLADGEGLPAHAQSARYRIGS